jgi:integrase
MGTIRFALQTDIKDKEGFSPIQVIYQISGSRKRKSTGEKAPKENWDKKEQQAIYIKKGQLSGENVKDINKKLADLRRDIERIEERFEVNKQAYSSEMVLDELSPEPKTQRDTSSKELFAFIDRYIEDNSYTRVHGSLSVYKSLKLHLMMFERTTRKKVIFDKIDYGFFQSFQNFLVSRTKKDKAGKTVRALNNITIAKQLSTLKTFLNYAKAQGIEVCRKYEAFKIKRETDLEVIALTKAEFDTLYSLNLSKNKAWEQVRDVFCLSCVTGLRYSDVKQLRREHIKEDSIDLTAVKTSHRTTVPLNPYSKTILAKYAENERPLPVISNQKSNEHLAKICEWAGIDTPVEIVRKYGKDRVVTIYKKHELIRFHCGRKTFASLSLEAGMRAEYVMKIGAWKDYKSFKRYMNLSDDSVNAAMQAAWGTKPKQAKLKAV